MSPERRRVFQADFGELAWPAMEDADLPAVVTCMSDAGTRLSQGREDRRLG